MQWNYGVALWKFSGDRLIRKARVRFAEYVSIQIGIETKIQHGTDKLRYRDNI
jgi:hypothetical protein